MAERNLSENWTLDNLEKVLNEMSGKEYSYLKTKLSELLISEIIPVGREIVKFWERDKQKYQTNNRYQVTYKQTII